MLKKPLYLLLIITGLVFLLPHTICYGQEISREEIQQFFRDIDGNAIQSPIWKQKYMGEDIHWQGKVFKTRNRPASYRQEVFVQILPNSHFYDTLVILEAGTPLNHVTKGAVVEFKGKIFHGTDTMGVKHVGVKLQSAKDIWIIDSNY